MRIAPQGQSDVATSSLSTIPNKSGLEGESSIPIKSQLAVSSSIREEQEVSKEKLQNVIDTVNKFLQINRNSSRFVLHDGLERYFVQVVDTDTKEVVKEIPPKKLLDAFYEMQKLLGMIVDEKI